jgi:predicted aconitase with swiveling domain
VKAFGGRTPERTIRVGPADLAAAAAELTSTRETALGAVSIGTPHFSYDEFTRLRALLHGRHIAERLEFFVSTGRDTLARVDAEGWGRELRNCGVQVVTDTCTYLTPILTGRPGAVMTNSAKWAWYAPNNLGYEVVFGSLEECVESAVRGEVWRDATQWGDNVDARPPAMPQREGKVDAQADTREDASPLGLHDWPWSVTQTLVEGIAEGEVLVLDEPLSFWGGVREESGIISDIHHPQHGASLANPIVLMPSGRGSSSSSSVLAELIRGGVAPAAILMGERDPIIALGAMVGEALYERTVVVAVLARDEYERARSASRLRVSATREALQLDVLAR